MKRTLGGTGNRKHLEVCEHTAGQRVRRASSTSFGPKAQTPASCALCARYTGPAARYWSCRTLQVVGAADAPRCRRRGSVRSAGQH